MCMISFYKLFGISFMSNSIRHRLKEALIARGMSPAELAKTIGVGNGYISQLLSGYISQPKKNLTAICQALRVREQWMLTGKGPADADDENDGLIKIPLMNGMTNSTDTNKKYIECYGINDHADLEAYFLSASEFLDEDSYIVINKELKGNGLYLIKWGSTLFISIRKGGFISVEWHHFTSSDVLENEMDVIGKIIQMTAIQSKDIK